MKRATTLIILLVLSCIIGLQAAWLAYHEWYIVDTQNATIMFKVTNGSDLGFNIDPGTLAFGKVPQGGTAERRATVYSAVPAIAHIQIMGTSWVSPNMSTVELQANESKQVLFTLELPQDAPPGNYTGEVRIIYTRDLG